MLRDRRNRRAYAVGIVLVIVTGLLSRSPLAEKLPSWTTAYVGDTLWALALFLALGLVLPRARTASVALLTIALSFGVELDQLYQAEWINTIRSTRIGALLLGAGFRWSDLPCYTAGCLLGTAGEFLIRATRKTRSTPHN